MSDESVIRRVIAKVKAYLPRQWFGNAGKAFVETTGDLARRPIPRDRQYYADETARIAGGLAGKWVRGKASAEYSEAHLNQIESINRELDADLARITFDDRVRAEKARAEQADLSVIRERIKTSREYLEFMDELDRRGIIIRGEFLTQNLLEIMKLPRARKPPGAD
ncbi:MAG: hypothetical protein Q8K82_18520 [Gemmatimonadaceae bacterium]|nr:hypothetical protein [Gemmatimonadaceae bacterium]